MESRLRKKRWGRGRGLGGWLEENRGGWRASLTNICSHFLAVSLHNRCPLLLLEDQNVATLDYVLSCSSNSWNLFDKG